MASIAITIRQIGLAGALAAVAVIAFALGWWQDNSAQVRPPALAPEASWNLSQRPQIGPRVPHRSCTGGEEQQTDQRAEWRRQPSPARSDQRRMLPSGSSSPGCRVSARVVFSPGLRIRTISCRPVSVTTMPPSRHWTAGVSGAATIFAVLDPMLAIAPNGGRFARMVV